ncbi:MAG: hypothetical protein GWO00_13350, partial [Gemmatimonadetes bacterium]|nr:hypothetical protein [Gemmatimonadota bacterium]NIU36436.1 hypothetical protein [Gemmatimonadota bacterium]NIV62183.1 hypothetical protein [Gemmatimonadota bacterium]NIV83348.1 hypothetical protein [Gemmatimonadota bacterium]NIW64905.1 hypothetical protein [Gemmatimonadota bacterium]
AAVLSGTPVEGAATAPVAYASRGRVLVLGEDPRTVQVLDGLDEGLAGVAVIPAGSPARPTGEDSRVVRGEVTHLEGYLGAFDVRVATGEGEERPVRRLGSAEENFDLVVDLGEPPRLQV